MDKSTQTYELLKNIAAETTEPITYGHLAAIIDSPRWRLAPLLKKVHDFCVDAGQPDLTAFVVSAATGQPRDGFASVGGTADQERKLAFKLFRELKWGVKS